MYKIGDFSILAKTTIKTLRYYEKEELLKPSFVDKYTGYRYYETKQLVDLAKIMALRQIGLKIEDIKNILRSGENIYKEVIRNRKTEIEKEIINYNNQLSKINYILEGNYMDYEVIIKELPDYTIYYKEGRIKDFSELTKFILQSAEECKKINPDVKCVLPDYCYVSYLDKEFKEKNMKIRYAQAVEKEGQESETIKFQKLKPVKSICIYHKGSYENLPRAYSFIMKYISENNYKMIEPPRERYIDGIWNKENQNEWLTEIQVPVEKHN